MPGHTFDDLEPMAGGRFHTTHWSVVLQAGQAASPQRSAALERLCRDYWQPIFNFARRKGCREEDAKDLTQQFFSRLLERDDFAGLDARRGKFRTFLLAAFTHFLANDFDRTNALKRGGGKIILSLDDYSPEQMNPCELAVDCSPAKVFDLRWAQTVLERALATLRQEIASTGKAAQFEALKRFLTADANAADYAEVAKALGVADASVPVLVHRLRQRYRQCVRAEVAQTVASPTELEEEMRYLFQVLNQ